MTAIQDNVKARITKKSYFFDLYCQSYEETITVDNTAETDLDSTNNATTAKKNRLVK